jgi:hypothetical protein
MIEYDELVNMVHSLPSEAQRELLDFAGYLKYKHQLKQSGPVVPLGGLWVDVDLDVSDEDVRGLREQVTRQLLDKV